MLYWCLIPRSGQKFFTFSDSSKEWIFSSFLIWNDGPLRRLLIKQSTVWSVIPYRGEKWDSFKILKYPCWKSQVNTLIHSSLCCSSQHSLVASLSTRVLLILISTELSCPKSSQQHPCHRLGYVLLRKEHDLQLFTSRPQSCQHTCAGDVPCKCSLIWRVAPKMM